MKYLYTKAGTAVYIVCLILIAAVCLLLYTNGIIRDRCHASLDGMGLMQILLILAAFAITLLTFRRASRYSPVNNFLCILSIPIFIYAMAVIVTNTISAKNIIISAISMRDFMG